MTMGENSLLAWVDLANSPEQTEFRRAVHTTLLAIAKEPLLQEDMIIKGGILMAIRFESDRFTRDIDFSTSKSLKEIDKDEVSALLDRSLAIAVASLDYGLDCRVQTCQLNPKRKDATFPSIRITIGYAYQGTSKHKKLQALSSSTTIPIDYSLNELTHNVENLNFFDSFIRAYALSDVIAEKYRSLLQQVVRDRLRRQDVFDIYTLITNYESELDAVKIHQVLLEKSHSRDIYPQKNSMADEEIKARAQAEYLTLQDEIVGDLPLFDLAYSTIQKYYESFDWR